MISQDIHDSHDVFHSHDLHDLHDLQDFQKLVAKQSAQFSTEAQIQLVPLRELRHVRPEGAVFLASEVTES